MDGSPFAAAPTRRLPLRNLLLFLATVVTAVVMPLLPEVTAERVAHDGIPYAAALVGILLCHELGHYLMARAYGVSTTLPYFIPGPPPVGTFGAVIRMRSPMPSRGAVLDIGAAGPIAGLAVALPLLAWGLAHSEVRPLRDVVFANTGSLLDVARAWMRGEALVWEGPVLSFGDSLLTWLLGRLTVGALPPGHDVFLHPVGLAAWFGLLVTTLNLFPMGQLDGGHVLYAWLGRARARAVSRGVSLGLLALGVLVSWNWLVWWLLTRLVGLGHPPALVEEPLGPGRKAVAVLSLVLFAATFVPMPVRLAV